MKKFLLGSVGLAAMLAGPAMAADMPVAPPPPPVVYYDWSGAYIGGNIGWVGYNVDRTFPNFLGNPPRDFSTSDDNGIFGFHAGAQWQWGAWVLGVEAALSGCTSECRSVSGLLPSAGGPTVGFAADRFAEHKMTNLFTVGPRIGYAWDRWMIFGTGGWASADLKGTYCVFSTGQCLGTAQSGASRSTGWYAGGGLDYMVFKGPLVDVILGAEYQHYDVRGDTAFIDPTAPGANFDLSSKGDIVRARLTIKTQGYGGLGFWR